MRDPNDDADGIAMKKENETNFIFCKLLFTQEMFSLRVKIETIVNLVGPGVFTKYLKGANTKFRFGYFQAFYDNSSGPSCSKLTTSLVNVSLKFRTSISQICQYFG